MLGGKQAVGRGGPTLAFLFAEAEGFLGAANSCELDTQDLPPAQHLGGGREPAQLSRLPAASSPGSARSSHREPHGQDGQSEHLVALGMVCVCGSGTAQGQDQPVPSLPWCLAVAQHPSSHQPCRTWEDGGDGGDAPHGQDSWERVSCQPRVRVGGWR